MDECRTPQKVLSYSSASVKQFYKTSPATFKLFNNHIKAQISNSQKGYGKIACPNLILQTPDKKIKEFISTPGSSKKCASSSAKSFHLFPISNTSPSENISGKKVINPFEAALTADRLHLPLICSPSLFHRPSTPQYSSTHFEWTIEEVSSIGPANLEAHETQFQDCLDPEIEAKTQAAISSFFKEQQIVPSPIDCPLRKHRIILAAADAAIGSSPSMIRPAKRIRDGVAQTILTLPPVLPKELEDALKPFFNFLENQQQSPTINCDKNNSLKAYHEARDASLRRQLFATIQNLPHNTNDNDSDEHEIFESSAMRSPAPKSPDVALDSLNTSQKEDEYSNNFDKNSFGSLSPISKLSPNTPNPKRFSSERRFMNNSESENISPIKIISPSNVTIQQRKINSTSLQEKILSVPVDSFGSTFTDLQLYRSTPDNSMQLKNSLNESHLGTNNNMSVDSSFNCKVSRILVDSCSTQNENKICKLTKSKSMTEADIFNQNDFEDEDYMQVSQLSENSSNSSTSNADTPRRSKKAPSRKNLSRSFSSQFSDEENDVLTENLSKDIRRKSDDIMHGRILIQNLDTTSTYNNDANTNEPNAKCVFYRTDSGFNEMTNTQDGSKFVQIFKNPMSSTIETQNLKIDKDFNNMLENEDISMISCSTPSRRVF